MSKCQCWIINWKMCYRTNKIITKNRLNRVFLRLFLLICLKKLIYVFIPSQTRLKSNFTNCSRSHFKFILQYPLNIIIHFKFINTSCYNSRIFVPIKNMNSEVNNNNRQYKEQEIKILRKFHLSMLINVHIRVEFIYSYMSQIQLKSDFPTYPFPLQTHIYPLIIQTRKYPFIQILITMDEVS